MHRMKDQNLTFNVKFSANNLCLYVRK